MFQEVLHAYKTEKVPLHCPPLEEVAKVLDAGFKKNFADAAVQVVQCPDLTTKPFHLVAPGLCGRPMVSDVGGVPYLVPFPKGDKRYSLRDVAQSAGIPDAFIVGAGAGPAHVVGTNSEMMVNAKLNAEPSQDVVRTRICKLRTQQEQSGAEKRYVLEEISAAEACLLVNLYLCDGKPGQVLEVTASDRTGPENFMSCMSKALKEAYGEKPVAVGGTFCLEKGRCKMHVMPDFSKEPITSNEDMENWLQYFEMEGPITCVGYLISHDPGLDLRMEHFHGFSLHGDGGHYHYDTTPHQVQYRAYLNVAEYMVRCDAPKHSHLIGRD